MRLLGRFVLEAVDKSVIHGHFLSAVTVSFSRFASSGLKTVDKSVIHGHFLPFVTVTFSRFASKNHGQFLPQTDLL